MKPLKPYLLLITAVVLGLAGDCTFSEAHHGHEHDHSGHTVKGYGHHATDMEDTGGVQLKGESIHHLEGEWVDSTGTRTTLSGLKGRPVVVAMAYTRCKYICPMIVSEMKQLREKLSSEKREKTIFALFSLDSRYDQPKVLAEYAKRHSLDPEGWRLLSGATDSVRELAAVLGVKYKLETNGEDFSHSYIITILDSEGVIRKQLVGFGQPLNPIAELIEEL